MSDQEQVAIFLKEARRRLGAADHIGDARMIAAAISCLEKHFTGATPTGKEMDAVMFLFSGRSWREWEEWWAQYR